MTETTTDHSPAPLGLGDHSPAPLGLGDHSPAPLGLGDHSPAGVLSNVDFLEAEEFAARLGMPVTRLNQLLREGQLIGVRTRGVNRVPADFLDGSAVLKYLPGVITVLRDGGFEDLEILQWLFTVDDSLPGRPVDALRDQRHKEITRRAQALAL